MKQKAYLVGLLLCFSMAGFAGNRLVTTIGENGWKLWLDKSASWRNDALYLPPVDISALKVAIPSCGWDKLFVDVRPAKQVRDIFTNPSLSLNVNVPGTVEEYCWDALSNNKGLGNSGDYVGVSWWGTDFKVSALAKGNRIKLYFSEGIRQRAEIFVNEKLVGYELIQQTPFEVDVTDMVVPDSANKLAVRITDPNGNFSWGDYTGEKWGDYQFPLSHGFGGILGEVQLKMVSPLYVADVFVKNKSSLTDIDVDLELKNENPKALNGFVDVAIVEAWQNNLVVENPKTVFTKCLGKVSVQAGKSAALTFAASVPEAKLWGIRNANLYNLVTTVKDKKGKVIDQQIQRFGFRFLSVEGYGKDARFYFNGKKTFLISAISWGFWPTSGIYPTKELARKHIESAFALGQNMLNFHRCQGNTRVLDLADEMGILYYEEPGGYSSGRRHDGDDLNNLKNKDLAAELNLQRLLRMVKRDRNHPSLVYYNFVNEPGWNPDEAEKVNMAEAHLLDPTRFMSYGSGFMSLGKDEPKKLHMLPYDQTQRTVGYTDIHNAGNSPGVYMDEMYTSAKNFIRNEKAGKELFVWGEEGALASPPQLEMIVNDLEKKGTLNGWDGADYKQWYAAYNNYIQGKGLTRYYPSMTKLITSLADVMYYEHGRVMENARIADDADIYVYNGYEDMKNDNFSGSVDVFRNIKGTPELLSQYAQPLYVAVKVCEKTGHIGDTNYFDIYVINEHAVPAGEYTVRAMLVNPQGVVSKLYDGKVKVTGGDKFSDLVTEQVPVILNGGIGYYKIKAELLDTNGHKIATGHDEIFAVDWKSDVIGGKGAILGGGADILRFAKDVKHANIVKYQDKSEKLDYILVGSTDQGKSFKTISSFNFRAKDGQTIGLDMDYFKGMSFDNQVDHRISTAPIDFNTQSKLIPGYDILGNTKFSLRWEGSVVAEYSGETEFELTYDDGLNLWFDGTQVSNDFKSGGERKIIFKKQLLAGKSYRIKIEAFQDSGDWTFSFKWKLPVTQEEPDMEILLKRVKEDGTKLILIEDAEYWLDKLKTAGAVPSYRVFHPDRSWVGSSFFVREHPFFNGLPVNVGMNWEYQRLVLYNGPKHFGLYDLKGEEAIVSMVGSPFHEITTSVGILPYGKGQIVFSSLDLIPNLSLETKASNVPKKIFCNYLKWATQPNAPTTYFLPGITGQQ